jgi:tetratricopeptide (TPR) repeat protein
MAINAEQLNIIIAARTIGMQRELDAAQRKIKTFERKTKDSLGSTTKSFDLMSDAAGRLGGALSAGALATGMVASIKSAIDAGAAIHNLAMIAGTGTTEFQKFAIAAQTVGIEQDKLADILKDVNDKFGDYMATGAGPLADFFDNIAPKVGITKDAFIGLSSDQALGLYVKTLEEAGVNQQEMTFYMEALASDATALNPLLRDNAAALTAIGESAESTGRILDEAMIKNAKIMQDTWTEVLDVMGAYWDNFWIRIGVGLTELLNIGDEAQLVNLRSDLDDAASAFASARSEFEPFGDPEYRADYIENYGVNEFNRAMGEAQERVEATGAAVKAIQESMKAVEASKIETILEPIVVTGDPGSGTSTADTKKGGGKSPAQQAKDDFDALIASLDGAEKANQDFAKAQEVVNNALKNGIVTQEQADMTLAVLTDRMKVARGEMMDLSSVAGVLEDGFTNAFMSILDGTESTKDAFRSMAKAVIAELYRVLVVQRLVGSIGGGGIVGAIGNIFPALTNSASGGALMAGQASVVGEHGRELFVPSTSGRVLSVPQAKAAMGGGGGVVVNQTINVTTGVQQTVRAEIKQLMPQIADSAKAAVLDAKRRGGAYGSAF